MEIPASWISPTCDPGTNIYPNKPLNDLFPLAISDKIVDPPIDIGETYLNPPKCPGKTYKWLGKGEPGSKRGSWVDKDRGIALHPDVATPGHDPHYDVHIKDSDDVYRLYPNGVWELKEH